MYLVAANSDGHWGGGGKKISRNKARKQKLLPQLWCNSKNTTQQLLLWQTCNTKEQLLLAGLQDVGRQDDGETSSIQENNIWGSLHHQCLHISNQTSHTIMAPWYPMQVGAISSSGKGHVSNFTLQAPFPAHLHISTLALSLTQGWTCWLCLKEMQISLFCLYLILWIDMPGKQRN